MVIRLLRPFLRLGLSLTFSFAVLLGLIQTQPQDDGDLRAFFALTQRCPSACLMGLRPGVTSVDRAIRVLDRNAWVTDLTNRVTGRGGTGELSWRWSADAPRVIDAGHPGRAWVSDGIVQAVTVDLRDTVGALNLVLATSSRGEADSSSTWQIAPLRECPLTLLAYWSAPARLQLIAGVRTSVDAERPPAFPVLACWTLY